MQAVDGEDHLGLRAALAAAREEKNRPSLVIVRTVIGRGSPNRAGKSKAHGEALGAEEARLTKQEAGWPLAPEFLIPDDVRAYFAERIREKRALRSEADAKLARLARRRVRRRRRPGTRRARAVCLPISRQVCATDSKARTTPPASTAPWCWSGSRQRRRTTSAAPPTSPARRRRRS